MLYIVELTKLELIKVGLLVVDKEFPCQTFNFLAYFSSIFTQSTACSLLGAIGTPKYLKGKNQFGNETTQHTLLPTHYHPQSG
jgi:hypothetical protein